MSTKSPVLHKVDWELTKFVISLSVGLLIIWAFGLNSQAWKPMIVDICEMLLLHPPADLKPWDCWEIGALLWSAFTSVMFYFFTPEIDQSHFGEVGQSVPINRVYGGILSLVMFVSHYGAAYTLFERKHGAHLAWLIVIGVAFGAIDALNYCLQKHLKEKIEAVHALLFADLPVIVAFVIFLVFETQYGRDKDTEIFLSGAISFQFVAATFAFAFIGGGVSQRIVDYTKRKAR
jgi:hypothetical protein